MDNADKSQEYHRNKSYEVMVRVFAVRLEAEQDLPPNLKAIGATIEECREGDGINRKCKKSISKMAQYEMIALCPRLLFFGSIPS